MGGGRHPWGHRGQRGSYHILLDLTVRHRDAQRSLSWGEGSGGSKRTPGSELSSPVIPGAAPGARPLGSNLDDSMCKFRLLT